MSQVFEIVRQQPEAEREREEERERFTRQAPDADASFEALEKASRKKPAKELELEDLPEELHGKAHIDGDAARIYADANKSKELFTVREDRLKSEKVDREAIRTMIAVAKVDDRSVEKRIETQIDKAQSGPTIDEMRDNIRQQEINRDKAKER